MREAGEVMRADIFQNNNGKSRGIGIVEFKSQKDAEYAVSHLHKKELDGRNIWVKMDEVEQNNSFSNKNNNPRGNTGFRDNRISNFNRNDERGPQDQ